VAEVIGQTRLDANQRNVVRIRVPTSWVDQAQQVLEAMPEVKQVTPADRAAGWLVLEVAAGADGDSSEEARNKNKVLEALIRAEIPIRGFEVAGGRLQDVFLHLTEEIIR